MNGYEKITCSICGKKITGSYIVSMLMNQYDFKHIECVMKKEAKHGH